MSEGGNITRIVLGESSWISEGDMNIIATDGDVTFSASKKVFAHGVEEGLHVGEYDWKVEEEAVKKGDFISGKWTYDYDGIKDLKRDSNGPKANLEETVYFQLNVSEDILVGTVLKFKLWDRDELNPDDDTFNGKQVYKAAAVRQVNGKNKITIELLLDQNWRADIVADKKAPFANGCLDFYWQWDYNNTEWNSEKFMLGVYFSETTLYIKPAISNNNYGLPEIYSNSGAIILYAIEKVPNGTIKKFSMIKLRTITTFKLQADINKFKREIYHEAINLETNRLESASYTVEEGAHFFKTNKNTSQIFIDETIVNVPIDARGMVAVKNFGVKALKFAKVAAEYFGHYQVLKEMKEMIPELSSNEEFNMPSLSTFVGFIPQLQVVAFGVEVIGWMVEESLRESKEIVDESMWADWQNAKGKGLRNAQDFIQSGWAIENRFNLIELSKEMVNKLLKGEIKTLEELEKLREKLIIKNYDEYRSTLIYTAFYTLHYDKDLDKDLVLIDSIFIKQ